MQTAGEPHRVAVYGTLKRGYGNHRLLADSEFIGKAKTEDAYPLLVNGLPYLYDKVGVGEDSVKVYDVDDYTLAELDALEGHPTFYERRKIWVSMDDWSKSECWVCFINQELPRGTRRGRCAIATQDRASKETMLVSDLLPRLILTINKKGNIIMPNWVYTTYSLR